MMMIFLVMSPTELIVGVSAFYHRIPTLICMCVSLCDLKNPYTLHYLLPKLQRSLGGKLFYISQYLIFIINVVNINNFVFLGAFCCMYLIFFSIYILFFMPCTFISGNQTGVKPVFLKGVNEETGGERKVLSLI